jgi:hypothetical protein
MLPPSLSLVKRGWWRARWDLNPGPPAPQASVIIRTRLRAPATKLLPSPEIKGRIVNTLLKLKNSGLEEQTVKIAGFYLNHI